MFALLAVATPPSGWFQQAYPIANSQMIQGVPVQACVEGSESVKKAMSPRDRFTGRKDFCVQTKHAYVG